MFNRPGRWPAAVLFVAAAVDPARGETIEDLRREIETMKETVRTLERKLEALGDERADDSPAVTDAAALDQALAEAREDAPPPAAAPPPALAARRLGDANLRLIDVSLGTLVAAGGSTASDVDIGLILHGEQHYEYLAPVHVGDRITCQTQVMDIYDKKGGALWFVVSETELKDEASGRAVAKARGVTVVRNPNAAKS
jgi:acyl dehydratase